MQRMEDGPVFPVQFSRLRHGLSVVTEDESIFEPRRIVLRTGFGYAPVLQAGTIWEDRVFKRRWPFKETVFETVVSTSVPVVHAYGKVGIDGNERFIIPSGQFFIDARVAGSKVCCFQAITDGKPVLLLIPCMEIFRFYYGHSTKLAYRILRGDFLTAPYSVYIADGSFVASDGTGRLELAPTMDGGDAYTVARFVLDPTGLARARVIVERAMLDAAGSTPIDVLPPFDGLWRLKVRGKWLSYGREHAFLVFAIVRCAAAVSFNHLEVFGGRAADVTSRPAATIREERRAPIERRKGVPPSADLTLEKGEPSARSLPQRLPTLDSDDRYPQMGVRYAIRRRKKNLSRGRKANITAVEDDSSAAVADLLSETGPSEGSFGAKRTTRKSEIVEGRNMLDLYERALNALPKIAREISISCIIERRTVDLVEAFSGIAPPIAFIDRKSEISRVVLLAEVQLGEARAAVMEIQRRPGVREESRTIIVIEEAFNEVGEEKINKLLVLWASRGGHLRDIRGLPALRNLRLSGVNHRQSDTAETYATRMLDGLVRLILDIEPDVALQVTPLSFEEP
jgi:hypothetical protein